MKGQVFTLDLIVGFAIIVSILATAYYISNQNLLSEQSSVSNINVVSRLYSVLNAFANSNLTLFYIDKFQNSNAAISSYLNNQMSLMSPYPFNLSIFAKENYSNNAIPNTYLMSVSSPVFHNYGEEYSLSSLIVIYNQSKACVKCDDAISAKSGFPQQNVTVNAAECTVYTPSGVNVLSDGWEVYNKTPSSNYCTITIGKYSNALPTSYLVKAYNGTGTYLGNTTLHVLALDLIKLTFDI